MTILDVVLYPDKRLTYSTEPVVEITAEVRSFCADLAQTMVARFGCGMAAPQVGRPWQIFVLNYGNGQDGRAHKFFINPVIESSVGEQSSLEGCLSVPGGVFATVSRPLTVTVSALDIDGNSFTMTETGFWATAISHEYDHLIGRVFLDRLSPERRDEALSRVSSFKSE